MPGDAPLSLTRTPAAGASERGLWRCLLPLRAEAHAAFLVAVAGARDTAVLPADRGRTPGHCTAAPSARGRHVTGPPGRARRLRQPGRPEPTRHALEPRRARPRPGATAVCPGLLPASGASAGLLGCGPGPGPAAGPEGPRGASPEGAAATRDAPAQGAAGRPRPPGGVSASATFFLLSEN